MTKEKDLPEDLNNRGVPTEINNLNTETPILEVNQPIEAKDPLEFRTPDSITLI